MGDSLKNGTSVNQAVPAPHDPVPGAAQATAASPQQTAKQPDPRDNFPTGLPPAPPRRQSGSAEPDKKPPSNLSAAFARPVPPEAVPIQKETKPSDTANGSSTGASPARDGQSGSEPLKPGPAPGPVPEGSQPGEPAQENIPPKANPTAGAAAPAGPENGPAVENQGFDGGASYAREVDDDAASEAEIPGKTDTTHSKAAGGASQTKSVPGPAQKSGVAGPTFKNIKELRKALYDDDTWLRDLEIQLIAKAEGIEPNQVRNPYDLSLENPERWIADRDFHARLGSARERCAQEPDEKMSAADKKYLRDNFVLLNKGNTDYARNFACAKEHDPQWYQSAQAYHATYASLQSMMKMGGQSADEIIKNLASAGSVPKAPPTAPSAPPHFDVSSPKPINQLTTAMLAIWEKMKSDQPSEKEKDKLISEKLDVLQITVTKLQNHEVNKSKKNAQEAAQEESALQRELLNNSIDLVETLQGKSWNSARIAS